MDYKILYTRVISSVFLISFFSYILIFHQFFIKYIFIYIYLFILYEVIKNFKFSKSILVLYIYIFLSFVCIQIYFLLYFNLYIFILYCLIIISFDSFSYIFGSKFGSKKIFKKISPNKTYFGLISGVSSSFFLSLLFNSYSNSFLTFKLIGFIILILLLSFTGDAIESAYKRMSKIKDSGNIIPGHGGFFDRFDSFILSNFGLVVFSYFIY